MAMQRCVFCYLLNIILSTIIKANAIIVTITNDINVIVNNCINKVSIICTTSLSYVKLRWQPHSASPNFLVSLYKRLLKKSIVFKNICFILKNKFLLYIKQKIR